MYYNIQTSCTPHYENVPFEIPNSWEWVRLDEICDKIVDGDHNPPKGLEKQTQYLMISSRNINHDKIESLENVRYLSKEIFEVENERTRLNVGDILFTSVGSLGRSCVYNGGYNLCFQRSVSVIHTLTYNSWVKCFFDSDYYQNLIIEKATGTAQMGFYLQQLSESYIALPPYTEQLQIVSEIEQWFALINDIEANKLQLQEFIGQAKSKIINRAIHGKLVPQDPDDEPATELLKRIAPHSVPGDTSHYENLPKNWAITTMSNLCKIIDGEKQSNINRIYLDVKYLRGKSDGEYMMSGKYVPANSTMILVDGENSGEIFTTTIDGYQGSTFKILDISEEMYKPFVLYVILSYQKQLRENKVGSAIPHLNKKLFREIVVEVPPYEEQKRIVNKIDELFSFIDSILLEL